jgi:hypothetical protein
MAFSFKLKGNSLQSVVAEMSEMRIKALEDGVRVDIKNEHLLDAEPYVIVTCDDKQKGMRLLERVGREVPRYSIL